MPDEPTDPLSPLGDMAAQNHELYLSYIAAGFTAEQSLRLLIAVIQETIRANLGGA